MHHRSVCASLAVGIAATTALLATLAGGCAKHHSGDDVLFGATGALGDVFSGRTFAIDDPVELRTRGPLAVDVESFAGDVVVRADRKIDRTTVEVRRVSTHGLGRLKESADELSEPNWTATLRPRDGGGETLFIRATTPNPEPHFQRLEVTVYTPSLDSVRVRTTNGDVTIIENQGPVDVETTRGDVRMMTPWPMTQPMTIVTSEGSIDYRVRGESKGTFDCESHGGQVRQRAEYGSWIALDPSNDHDRFLAVLNGGRNPVVLRTSDEDIRVSIVPDPTAVGMRIFDP